MLSEYGFDLQLIPVILLLLSILNFKRPLQACLISVLLWSSAMIGWMSYPIYALYLPFLVYLCLHQLWTQLGGRPKIKLLPYLLISGLAFILPLVIGFSWVTNRQLLIFDDYNQGGIFRGAGSLVLDADSLATNLGATFTNFFIEATSYHFDLYSVEFSYLAPWLSVLVVFVISVQMFARRQFRRPIVLAWLLFLADILLVSLTVDPSSRPGLRRNTPILVSFYCLMSLSWNYLLTTKFPNQSWRFLALASLIIIVLHHLLVFPLNYSHQLDPSQYRVGGWFELAATPQQSLDQLLTQLQAQDLKLNCQPGTDCRYSEIYATLAGACEWNRLTCHSILGTDPATHQLIPLSRQLWDEHQFEH